jgi:hypothetical protein
MKPIDQDTIDFAEDFFFKLSEAQLREMITEFKKKQWELCKLLTSFESEFESQKNKSIVWRFGLITDYCFNSFYGRLPVISLQTIQDYFDREIKASQNKPNQNDKIDYDSQMDAIGQPELMFCLGTKINDFFNEKILDDEGANKMMLGILSIGELYKNEAEKLYLEEK